MIKQVLPRNCRGVRRGDQDSEAFTLIELIVVVGVIIVLAGLVLSTAGYARKKSARARAETEIAAMSAACENYKADNGVYPYNGDTNALDARSNGNPTSSQYASASLYLYNALFGATNGSRTPDTGKKSYFIFKPNMLFSGRPVAKRAVRPRSVWKQLWLFQQLLTHRRILRLQELQGITRLSIPGARQV